MSEKGELIPKRSKLQPPTVQNLRGINFSGDPNLLHLQLYHLIYKTKKLKKSTLKRMKRKQIQINKRKRKLLISKTPEEIQEKAERVKWVEKANEIIKAQRLDHKEKKIKKTIKNMKNARSESKRQETQKQQKNTIIVGTNHPYSDSKKQDEIPILNLTDKDNKVKGIESSEDFPSLL